MGQPLIRSVRTDPLIQYFLIYLILCEVIARSSRRDKGPFWPNYDGTKDTSVVFQNNVKEALQKYREPRLGQIGMDVGTPIGGKGGRAWTGERSR